MKLPLSPIEKARLERHQLVGQAITRTTDSIESAIKFLQDSLLYAEPGQFSDIADTMEQLTVMSASIKMAYRTELVAYQQKDDKW
jgi:hypothetical protein